mmetsp:Transcript_8023/g.14714  ORF Transcript_8023/g.14714 Transcript_8023/m.14714 type:complete len:2180 (+) Transcript_8023:151-6690(+)
MMVDDAVINDIQNLVRANDALKVGESILEQCMGHAGIVEWFVACIESEYMRETNNNGFYRQVLEVCIRLAKGPQVVRVLATAIVQHASAKGIETKHGMVHLMELLNVIFFSSSDVKGLGRQVLQTLFPSVLNITVGFCASQVGGAGDNDLCVAISMFLLRKECKEFWVQYLGIAQQMLLVLSQDMTMSVLSCEQTRRTTGVLSAWLIVWIGCSRQGDIEAWSTNVGVFAQTLFSKSCWDSLDDLGLRCTWWIGQFEETVSPSWYNLSIALTSALRRPKRANVRVVLDGLEQIAWRLPSETVQRLLFAPGGAVRKLISRDVETHFVKRFYLKCADEEALANDIVTTFIKDPKVDRAWALFELDLAQERGLSITVDHDIGSTLQHLEQDPVVQLAWFNAVFDQIKDVDRVIQLAMEHGWRRIILVSLLRCESGISERTLYTLCENEEDWVLRRAVIESVPSLPFLSLLRLDDVSEQVSATAIKNIGLSEGTVDHDLLDLYRNELNKRRHQITVKPSRFLLDALFSSDALARFSEAVGNCVNTCTLDEMCGKWMANQLVRQKLRTRFGPASATLPKLNIVLDRIKGDTRLNQVLLLSMYFLEISMFDTTANGEQDSNILNFFIKNRGVCNEWVKRARPLLLKGCAQVSTSSAQFIWNGWMGLKEGRMERKALLTEIGKRLTKTNQPDTVSELLQWLGDEDYGSPLYRTLNAASLQASHKFEQAAKEFEQVLVDSNTCLSSVAWCANGALECFQELQDWDCVDNWIQKLETMQEDAWAMGKDALADALAVSDQAGLLLCRSLSAFDRGDYQAAQSLVERLGENITPIQQADAAILRVLLEPTNPSAPQLLSDASARLKPLLEDALQWGTPGQVATVRGKVGVIQSLLHRETPPCICDTKDIATLQHLHRIARGNHLVQLGPKGIPSQLLVKQVRSAIPGGNLEFAKKTLDRVLLDTDSIDVLELRFALLNDIDEEQRVALKKSLAAYSSSPVKTRLLVRLADVETDEDEKGELLKLSGSWLEYANWAYAQGEYKAAEEAYWKVLDSGDNLTNCLRLLELFSDTSNVPDNFAVKPWVCVVPQLIGRCNLPVVKTILVQLAKMEPARIVWDVVAARQELPKDLQDSLIECLPNYEYATVVISQLVDTAIWVEERWYALMERMLTQKAKTLEAYYAIQGNILLDDATKTERYISVMQPTISTLRDMYSATFAVATSRNYTPFQNIIKVMIDAVETFLENGIDFAWNALEKQHRSLQQWMKLRQKETKLEEFAPRLFDSSLSSRSLWVPGTANVCIDSFVNRVVVLNTKTRPKRLWIKGSDGKEYGFLLKGGEDLRVDQRIMQVGDVLNGLLTRNDSHEKVAPIRTYQVVPLSSRVGLIQWMNHATPFLSIYRKFHESCEDKPPIGGTAYMSLIMKELKSALKLDEASVNALPRKEWPSNILQSVLKQAMDKVPDDLLWRELWKGSPHPAAWWGRTNRYAQSVAASSMFGYIIGLGDRHLDNIMIDMSDGPKSGQVVHIDYAVCFDKGKRLRVPETVPFRLTKIMRGALPFSSSAGHQQFLGGTYGKCAREVLGTIRANKSLIESFIKSLVENKTIDWMSEEEKVDYSLDVNVSIALLSSEMTKLVEIENDSVIEEMQEMCKLAGNIPVVDSKPMDDRLESYNQTKLAFKTTKDELATATDAYTTKRTLLQQKLRTIRQQQAECDSMQAQLANGAIGLQEEHVVSRLKSVTSAAIGKVLSTDDKSLVATMRDTDPKKDANFLTGLVDLRNQCNDAIQVLIDLRDLLQKYTDLKSYGDDTIVEDWLNWFQKTRKILNRALEHDGDDLEIVASELQEIVSALSPGVILENIKREGESCTDAKRAWQNAVAIQWYWRTSGGSFERTLSSTQAIDQHSDIRRRLLQAQQKLAASIEAFRSVSKQWKGTGQDSKRKVVSEILDTIKPLTILIDSVTKIEAHSRDLRILSNDGKLSIAALDQQFFPLLAETKEAFQEYTFLAKHVKHLKQTLESLAEQVKKSREAYEEAKLKIQDTLDEKRSLEKKIAHLTTKVRESAHVDNVQVWSNISNIRRGANKEGPFYSLATKLTALRNKCVEEKDFNTLVSTCNEIRVALSELSRRGNTGSGDYGRQQLSEDSKKKRKQAMAADILKRMQHKLDSQETVTEQVETLTNQATSNDRLSRIYEGWMPFV